MHGQIKSRRLTEFAFQMIVAGSASKSVGPSKFPREDMKTIIIAFMSTRTC